MRRLTAQVNRLRIDEALFSGYGYEPHFIEGDEPKVMHQVMADTLDAVLAQIKGIQDDARAKGFKSRPRWPMIVVRTPKGWTGPKVVDDLPVESTFCSHQVPEGEMAEHPEHVKIFEEWMKGYRPEDCSTRRGNWCRSWPH
jgi:xylulose-5-phosphate/fructose-6-phosphate phosphoketolase